MKVTRKKEYASVLLEKVPALMAPCALTRNVSVVTSQLVKMLKLQHVILPTVNACVEQVLDAQI